MKIKKNIFMFTILLTLLFAFTACGSNNSSSDVSTAENTETPSEAQDDNEAQLEVEDESDGAISENNRQLSTDRRLRLTLDDSVVVYAELVDSLAVDLFVEQLPITIDMDTYIERNKRGPLPFVIADEDLHNITYPFETGDIIYYPPGPLLGIFYDHNGAEISAGYELLARLDEEGIEAFATAPAELTVTVELDE